MRYALCLIAVGLVVFSGASWLVTHGSELLSILASFPAVAGFMLCLVGTLWLLIQLVASAMRLARRLTITN